MVPLKNKGSNCDELKRKKLTSSTCWDAHFTLHDGHPQSVSLIYTQIQTKYEALRLLIDYLKYQHLLLILKRETLLMTKVLGRVK